MMKRNIAFFLLGQDGVDLGAELDDYRKDRGLSWKELTLTALQHEVDDITLANHLKEHLKNLPKAGRPTGRKK